jgi:membrane protein YqaA with SNARE-associated domain
MSPIKRIMKRGHIYHVYYRRSGTYRFIGVNALKLLALMIVLGFVAYLINKHVIPIDSISTYLTNNFSTPAVFIFFFFSEATLGLFAPELLLVWISTFSYHWLWALAIGVISYLGGMLAYYIGTRLHRLPIIHKWVDEKFAEQFKQIRKFGGILIILGTLTPLPYSPICIVSGVVNFPFHNFLVLTLTRFVRVFLYAGIIFKAF